MAFGRKKKERPKNYLGYALYRYDKVLSIDLGKIINAIKRRKHINPNRADQVVDRSLELLDEISGDISKENFKTDYRSDKTRDIIIALIEKLKDTLNKAKEVSYDTEIIEEYKIPDSLDEVIELRESLKSKMKDIESDYI